MCYYIIVKSKETNKEKGVVFMKRHLSTKLIVDYCYEHDCWECLIMHTYCARYMEKFGYSPTGKDIKSQRDILNMPDSAYSRDEVIEID